MASALIRRDGKTRTHSVFFRIPGVNAATDAVPPGIAHDGTNFLVSGRSGCLFRGAATIYLVSPAGTVGDYQTGFTTLTDIAPPPSNKSLVIAYARFSLPPPTVGFTPRNTLLGTLDRPTGLERVGNKPHYALSLGDGTLLRLTFQSAAISCAAT